LYRTLVDPATLARHLDDPRWVVIDTRHDLTQPAWGEEEYREEHIPGARFLHLDRDLAAPKTGRNGRHPLPSPVAAAATFGAAGIDADKQVVVYDQNLGAYAARCWWMLRWLGHDAVAVLDGGFEAWQRAGLPVAADVPAPRSARFAIRRVEPTIDTGEVVAALATGALTLIDARGAERYRGDVEPLDPVAGHIPGAVSRPFTVNLDADGKFRPAAALREEFAPLVAGRALDRIVHQCGSGVTACHNLLAMEIADLSGTRLYPGSWSEWCADPARPVARGE
jgi:thiosulfate/3-mercaptopyruvate sulfurtransferase